jgi:hypothetical protein
VGIACVALPAELTCAAGHSRVPLEAGAEVLFATAVDGGTGAPTGGVCILPQW